MYSMTPLFHTLHPAQSLYRVAIVGAGPAGFYTAHHLLNRANGRVLVDIFDRLPAPYGLSRYGVAPDHPEVKNCEKYMENIMGNPAFPARFFGNVCVGQDVSLADLHRRYHAIVLAYGCTWSDNQLAIDSAAHPAVIPARKLVNWYNGHPDSGTWQPPLARVSDVTIVGNGNVAIDVARVLLADPVRHWRATDIASHAMDALHNSAVKRVNIVARRGVLESAFSNKEIRELLAVSRQSGVRFVPISDALLDPIRQREMSLPRIDKRKFAILDKASAEPCDPAAEKELHLRFLLSPHKFVPDPHNPDLLEHMVLMENAHHEDPLTKNVSARPTGKMFVLKTQMAVLSIGYRGSKLEGLDALGFSYDTARNCLVNHDGRLLTSSAHPDRRPCPGWYTAGWIRNGPRGVIATTMMEAFDTAEKVLEDFSSGMCNRPSTDADITAVLPQKTVTWAGWQKIDRHELAAGKGAGKTREKIENADEMVRVAHAPRVEDSRSTMAEDTRRSDEGIDKVQ